MAFIELAKPRIIAIEERRRKYLLTLARVPKKAWMHYFDGILSTSENLNGKRVDSFDASSARIELVESLLTDAQGYGGALGAGWQKMIPLAHRMAAGNALVEVERGEPSDDEPIQLGAESVYLNAVWGADEKGAMMKYRGLCHRFQTPSGEQQRRYSRDSSRSRIVGGSRRGKTVWLGPQPMLVELYDELILSVEGYRVDGVDLGTDREAIVAEMDTYHKVAAADVLFSPAVANVVDEAE